MNKVDSSAYYRLIDVQDHEGVSKVDTRDLYIERINCIATNLRVDSGYKLGDVVRMDFVFNEENLPMKRYLRTSPISEIQVDQQSLRIRTRNSLYIFEPVTPPTVTYQDTADLIELYLTDEDDNFVTGYFYDKEKTPHKLSCYVHVGMFCDSCLIHFDSGIVCRYFPGSDGVTFYNTLYKQQDYSYPIRIHNVGRDALRIQFEWFHAVWTILPGQEKTIHPNCKEGADET